MDIQIIKPIQIPPHLDTQIFKSDGNRTDLLQFILIPENYTNSSKISRVGCKEEFASFSVKCHLKRDLLLQVADPPNLYKLGVPYKDGQEKCGVPLAQGNNAETLSLVRTWALGVLYSICRHWRNLGPNPNLRNTLHRKDHLTESKAYSLSSKDSALVPALS